MGRIFLWILHIEFLNTIVPDLKKNVMPISLNCNCLINYLWAKTENQYSPAFHSVFLQSSIVNSLAHLVIHGKKKPGSLFAFSLRLPWSSCQLFRLSFALYRIFPPLETPIRKKSIFHDSLKQSGFQGKRIEKKKMWLSCQSCLTESLGECRLDPGEDIHSPREISIDERF